MSSKQKLWAHGALAGAVIFWGLSFVATKIALETIPTFTLVFLRFSLSACVFCVVWLGRGFPSFSKKGWIKISLLSVFEPGLYFTCETLGLQYTSAPKASLIIATIPVFVTLLSILLLKERTGWMTFLGVAASMVGISILVTGARDFSWSFSGQMLGDALIFGAVASASLYIILARDLGQTHSALTITGMQAVFGTLLFAPAFLWELPRVNWASIAPASWLAYAYLTFFATIAAFLCWNYALRKVTASAASVFLNGVPVVTAIAAWVLLGESLTLAQTAGGALVLAGVYAASFRR